MQARVRVEHRPDEVPLYIAVVNGARIPCYNRTQVMFYRRMTTVWETADGEAVSNSDVYYWLCGEVGYYV